ncbi:DUF4230 domain-containing protein [Anaerosalibacter bizertensis]|uniref:DUF4230 domain-containing protein n=1 Tax=Anaerosalibacter bizertensis TaxID=932217 RepID=UPI001D01BAE6|nr:DUF4230 domain-containing protein [Anaerosalibacter bizertensis]MCB5558925.1 DUF4230 domain-containing protein [Anaerosalibacter bizertensis]MCG4585794.1 DUF4230 domain-containing protein [Anaerosalibacter bizertensis]
MRSKTKKKPYITIFLIILAIVIALFFYIRFSIKKETDMLSDTIEEEISKLLDLSTVKYNYTNVVAYKDKKKFNGLNMPFTNKGFLIKYSGYIKAGVDLKSAEIDVKDLKNVEIKLDKPKVLDNVINEEDSYVYDEKESVFNQLKLKDLYDVLVKEKENMEKEVIKKGILTEAEKNTKEILTSFLKNLGFKNVKIVFK